MGTIYKIFVASTQSLYRKNQIEFVDRLNYLTYLEMKSYLIFASFLAIAAINVNGQDSGQLLMGTLVRQGSDKNEALGDIPPEDAEEVKGKEVAKGQEENVEPENELMMGKKIADFDKRPTAEHVKETIGNKESGYETKKGSVLDNDVQTGNYVAQPAKVLGELLASGGEMPEEVEGEILAGDPVELQVLKME